jgi:hypothetical protein
MYIVKKDNKIILADDDRQRLETTLKFMPDMQDCVIEETDRPIDIYEYADTPEYVAKKNEQISEVRADLYSSLIDPLHAEKQRKVVLGTWTEEMEAEYVAKVKELTEQIQTENPYIETVD